MRDTDVIAVCLAVRSLARTLSTPPPVYLDLTSQPVACEGARTLAAVLQVGCGMQRLLLRQTRISDEGAAALGAALGSSSLKELDLGECVIRDNGVRLLVKGIQMHGTPSALTVLLLDGNPTSDAAVVELISLVESAKRPPALAVLSARPAAPRNLSTEVEAALRVVCELGRIELRGFPAMPGGEEEAVSFTSSFNGQILGQMQTTPASFDRGGGGSGYLSVAHTPCQQDRRGGGQPVLYAQPQPQPQPVATDASRRSASGSPARDLGGLSAMLRRSGQRVASSAAGTPVISPTAVISPTSALMPPELPLGKTSSHLAAWMASTERELRELKWLLGASAARLDGQHGKLMSDLHNLRGQLDTWTRGNCEEPVPAEERRLEVLETRFDALEQIVGREQSECAQMWQIVEAAAASSIAGATSPQAAQAANAAAALLAAGGGVASGSDFYG